MNRTFRTTIFVLVMLTVAGALMAAPLSGSAASAHVTIIQPGDAQVQTGKTYGEWSVVWWQYVLSLPNDQSPLFDPAGATCRVGQAGSSPVFFLVGTPGGAITRDDCKVPAGKVLFFPLFNAVGIPTGPGDTEDNLRARLASYMHSTRELHASIDGKTSARSTLRRRPYGPSHLKVTSKSPCPQITCLELGQEFTRPWQMASI